MNPPPLLPWCQRPGRPGPCRVSRFERFPTRLQVTPLPYLYLFHFFFFQPPSTRHPPHTHTHIFPLSPLSLCLPQFSAFDRLTPKPCFIPAPQAAADTSFRWRGLQRLTRYRRRTAGARIYMIFQPEAKPGQGGDGRKKKKEKKTKAAVTERTQRKAKARPK